MTVRRAYRSEAGEIAELWQELVAYHAALDAGLPRMAPDGLDTYAKMLLQRMDRSDTAVFVAVDQKGRLVGYALGLVVDLTPDMFVRQRGGLLADVYVRPSARRQGHGRQLVAAMIAWFRANDLSVVEWDVAAANTMGRAFWRSVGGREMMVRMRVNVKDSDFDD